MQSRFKDLQDIGNRLDEALGHRLHEGCILLGLGKTGTVVAAQLASRRGVELDVILTRNVLGPEPSGTFVGVVAPDGVVALDQDVARQLEDRGVDVDQLIARERIELRRLTRQIRGEEGLTECRGRDVILVADLLHAETAALAAIRVVRAQAPASVTVAAGVCTDSVVEALTGEADHLFWLEKVDDAGKATALLAGLGEPGDATIASLLAIQPGK